MFSWMWWAEGAAMERGGVEVAFWVATATGLGYTVQRAIKHTRHPHNMPVGRRRFWDGAKWPMVGAWSLAWAGSTWVLRGELGLGESGRAAVLCAVALASLAYAVVPGWGGGLRKSVWMKTPLIAVVWATATTHHPELGWHGILWAQRFVFIAGLTLPFDIRDLDVDKDHMETLPLVKSPKLVLSWSRRLLASAGILSLAVWGWRLGQHGVRPIDTAPMLLALQCGWAMWLIRPKVALEALMSSDEWTRERKTGWQLDGVLVMPYVVALTLYALLLMLAPVMRG
jgi:hypothetical protein